ncbi:MAG: malate dehydrogenase, partial [Methylococcaceae bacterium]|nr:malate dehydrogenase [Methylococcaceae bacterium]
VLPAAVKKVTIWGNHSPTEYPDIHHATVNNQEALSLVGYQWYIKEFIPTVQQRGTAIINVRGQSSAASAANAAIGQMRNWVLGTEADDWVSMAILSDGSYGIEPGLVFSFPVTVTNGQVSIVKGLSINEFSEERLRITEAELMSEREAVRHLF